MDLAKKYQDGKLAWSPKPEWKDGTVYPLAEDANAAHYLYRTIGSDVTRISQLAFLRLVERGHAFRVEAPTLWDVDFKTAVAQAELEDAMSRYAVLFELAPIGFLALSKSGLILDINIAGAMLLGVNRPFTRGLPLFASLLTVERYPREDPCGASPREASGGIRVSELRTLERTNYPLTLSVDDWGEEMGLTAQAPASLGPDLVCALMHRALEIENLVDEVGCRIRCYCHCFQALLTCLPEATI